MPETTTNSMGQNMLRPFFLTVLCAITFIGSIVGIVSSAIGFINAETEVERLASGTSKTQLKNLFSSTKSSSDELVRVGNLNVENYKKFSIGCIASYILCLVGSVLIYKLKRNGFYSFTLGTFFILLTHFLLFGDNFGVMGLSILAALTGLVFIILYGMNLKYMEEPEGQ